MEKIYRILMLEDSPTDAELIQRVLLKEWGQCEFLLTVTRDAFLKGLAHFSPDLILADNSLPQFDAMDALLIVREQQVQIPFIMVSGTTSEEYAVKIIKAGADDYILKDRLIRLPEAIKTALRHREVEQEKARVAAQLEESEKKYRVFIQRITDAFISIDHNWCYTYLNKQAGEMFRQDPQAMIGQNVWEVFPDAVHSPTYHAFYQAMSEQRYISNVDYYAPYDLWHENHIYPSADGITVFVRNITEKKKLELELLDRQKKEQQMMIAAAIEAQEKERNAIAIELHDNVNQILVGTNVLLSVIKDHPQKAAEMITQCMENLSLAIRENRKIAHELVTPNLRTESLEDQLRKLGETMLRPAGIDYLLEVTAINEEQFSDQQRLAIYRVAQEQCTNIVKYAKAGSVVITLKATKGQLLFRILDDGQGADPEKISRGIGLKNINNRISVFGGTVTINTKKGEGFELYISIPAA